MNIKFHIFFKLNFSIVSPGLREFERRGIFISKRAGIVIYSENVNQPKSRKVSNFSELFYIIAAFSIVCIDFFSFTSSQNMKSYFSRICRLWQKLFKKYILNPFTLNTRTTILNTFREFFFCIEIKVF